MKKDYVIFSVTIIICSVLVLVNSHHAAPDVKSRNRAAHITKIFGIDRPFWTPNRIGNYITNNGQLVSQIPTGSAGMEWPVGSNNRINFASGIWLAGKRDGEIVTAAGEYFTEFQPGTVAEHSAGVAGSPANPNDPRVKVYIINQEDVANPAGNPDYVNCRLPTARRWMKMASRCCLALQRRGRFSTISTTRSIRSCSIARPWGLKCK